MGETAKMKHDHEAELLALCEQYKGAADAAERTRDKLSRSAALLNDLQRQSFEAGIREGIGMCMAWMSLKEHEKGKL